MSVDIKTIPISKKNLTLIAEYGKQKEIIEAQMKELIGVIIECSEYAGKDLDVKAVDNKGIHIILIPQTGGDPSSGPALVKDIPQPTKE